MKRISKTVRESDKVQSYLDQLVKKTGAIKVGRLVGKSFNADAKFNRFLQSKVDQGLSFFTDTKKRNAMLDTIAKGYGLTSIEYKQALSIKMIESSIDETIDQLHAEVTSKDTLVLDGAQKAALVRKLGEVRKFLVEKLMPAAHVVANELGVLEDVPTPAPTPALEPAPAEVGTEEEVTAV